MGLDGPNALTGPAAERLAASLRPLAVQSGTDILRSAPGQSFFLVTRGVVGIYAFDRRGGHSAGLQLAGPGALIEAEVFGSRNGPTAAELVPVAKALGDAQLIAGSARALQTAADEDLTASRAVMAKRSERAGALAAFAAEGAFMSAEARLAACLVSMSQLRSPGARFHVSLGRLKQGDLADLVGITRRRVSTILTAWFAAGLAFQDAQQAFFLIDVSALDEAARTASASAPSGLFTVDRLLASGSNGTAARLAEEALAREPKAAVFAHRAALALARDGQGERAEALLSGSGHADASAECLSLAGRLAKDRADAAVGADGVTARVLYAEAAASYRAAFDKEPSAYAALNAASCAHLAGANNAARMWAERTLEKLGTPGGYWDEASRSEALLLLGREREASRAYDELRRHPARVPAEIVSTREQLARLARAGGGASERAGALLRTFAPPREAFYSGAIFAPLPEQEARLRDWVRARLDRDGIDVVLGAAAAGADVVIAEAAREHGVAVKLYLPEDPDAFLRRSVGPSGDAWVPRARSVLDGALSVEVFFPFGLSQQNPDYRLMAALTLGRLRRRAARFGTQPVGLFAPADASGPASTTRYAAGAFGAAFGESPNVLALPIGDGRAPKGQPSGVELDLTFTVRTCSTDGESWRAARAADALALALDDDRAGSEGTVLLDLVLPGADGMFADMAPKLPGPGTYVSPNAYDFLWLTLGEAVPPSDPIGPVATGRKLAPCVPWRLRR